MVCLFTPISRKIYSECGLFPRRRRLGPGFVFAWGLYHPDNTIILPQRVGSSPAKDSRQENKCLEKLSPIPFVTGNFLWYFFFNRSTHFVWKPLRTYRGQPWLLCVTFICQECANLTATSAIRTPANVFFFFFFSHPVAESATSKIFRGKLWRKICEISSSVG